MDRLKLGALGERLKTGGAQMGRMVSGKMKEILQAPTPESKMVDDATSESLEEPNWGLNLRICAMLNSEEFSGQEVVRAIKKKISGKSAVSQRLSLDLLEACAMNCDKVFSEIASEKVLDEMVRMIDNPQTDHSTRERALQLIRAWGESEDLAYLPVFAQTYTSLKTRATPPSMQDNGSSAFSSLGSNVDQQPLSPPSSYPVPNLDVDNIDHADVFYHGESFSVEEKKEFLVVTRNSVELLTTILNKSELGSTKDDLTFNMLEKCKHSQPVLQRIIETTSNDEVMLFEALNLNDELQQVVSKYEEMEASIQAEGQSPKNPETTPHSMAVAVDEANTIAVDAAKTEMTSSTKGESSETGRDGESSPLEGCGETRGDSKRASVGEH